MRKWAWLGLLLVAAFSLPHAAFAAEAPKTEWFLINGSSRLNFISLKKGNIAEVHHFETLKGSVDEDGKVSVAIDLASVQTFVDIRNERLKQYLFETAKFPVATITTIVDPKQFESLGDGQKASTSTEVTLTLHGVSQKIQAGLEVYKLNKGRVLIIPDEMILLDASQFGLGAGIDKLKELAKLDQISTAVPVGFYFVFERKRPKGWE
jgi:polyisoprenoid-binding protein YceI